GTVEYLEIVDPITLSSVQRADSSSRAFVAVRFGSVRLIDNLEIGESDPTADPTADLTADLTAISE
ncbi:MAG: pantoate--beta-alanine ligase, partial [Microthrixaceae bacterium]